MAKLLSFTKFEEVFNIFNKKYNINGKGKLIGNLKDFNYITEDIAKIGDEKAYLRQLLLFILTNCLGASQQHMNNKDFKLFVFNKINQYEQKYLKDMIRTLNKNDELNKHYQFSNKDINDLKKNLRVKKNNIQYSLSQAFFMFALASGKFNLPYELKSTYKNQLMKKENKNYKEKSELNNHNRLTSSEIVNRYKKLVHDDKYTIKMKYELSSNQFSTDGYLLNNNHIVLIRSLSSNDHHIDLRHTYLSILDQIDYFIFAGENKFLALPSAFVKNITDKSVHVKRQHNKIAGYLNKDNILTFDYLEDEVYDVTNYVNQFN